MLETPAGLARGFRCGGKGRLTFALALWLGLGGLTGGLAQAPAGHLVNRYSFTADATDSVGGQHGELLGGAAVANGAVVFNGSTAYVNLPNNLCTGFTSLTLEAWVTESGSGGWARLLDFGNSSGGEDAQGGGTSYIFVAWPSGSGNALRGCYRPPGAGETYFDVSPRPTQGVQHHFVWTQDAATAVARIYLDGTVAGTYNGFGVTPAQVGPTVNNWLGRSQYNDPWFNGSVDEFRIYDFALPATEISRNLALGPDAAPLGPVQFLIQPAPATVDEGQPVTLTADVTGAPPFQFQWQRNGSSIPGATALNLTLTTTLADQGASFRLCVTNSFTNATFNAVSTAALLTVLADTNPPSVVTVQSLGTNAVEVRFSEPLRPDTATNLGNYTLTGPGGAVPLSHPVLAVDGSVVTFDVAPLTAAAAYTLNVSGVCDRASAANPVPPGTQVSFLAAPLPLEAIGAPALTGTLSFTNGGAMVLTGSGTDFGGTSDQGVMTVVVLSGDFDQQVRLAGFTAPQPWARVGLIARESMGAGSPFAAAFASAGGMGCFFSQRPSAYAEAQTSGQFPVNYPQNWLRLRRVGNVFTAFAGYDGLSWTTLGSATLSLSNTLQVGLALASASASAPARATFSALGPTQSFASDVTAPPPEKLGPSSRRTQLVISEIMYKPAPRSDGRNLEFIEIYNANPWFQDLSNYRLSGDVTFTFPTNTIIPANGFFVVAAVPADVAAVYGLTGVFGPYTNRLTTSGRVRLHDEQGTILLEVNYSPDDPWPMGADGTGHSIVLARPSYGEGDPRAWDRSDVLGGSPGGVEAFRPSPLRNVVLNEILAHTDPPAEDALELYNHATNDVDVSGCTLSDDPTTNRCVLPAGTIIQAGGFLTLAAHELGFGLSAAGETIFFKNPDGTRVLDALRFQAQENGVAFGRSPDGAGQWYRLASPTLGANNAAPRRSDVVINEIMYHPFSGDPRDQYVELHNRGTQPVSLDGWSFLAGINFTFPTNAILAPGGYVVVAADALHLRSMYPQLNATNTFGDFAGQLSRSGERLALTMPDDLISTNANGMSVTNHIQVVVEEVTYADGGRWGRWSDGGGSSLELRDPRADRRLAANWGDSDESTKAPWTNVENTGTLDNGSNYGGNIGYAQIGLMDSGECLVDAVEVRPGTTGANYVANPEFNAGLTNWSLQGAFSRSSLQSTQGYGGSGPALQLRTYNRLFTVGNSAQCALTNTTLANGQTATMRFKARWLRGSADVVFRLNGNWFEAAGRLAVPANLGTPGLRNSRWASNAPPALYAVSHTPALPAGGQPVLVTARVSDPDGVPYCTLLYRVDPNLTYAPVAMLDDGTGGDEVAGDGLYTATLPAQSAGAMAAFVIEATDALGARARFPELLDDNAPARECAVRWGDPEPPGALGIYHLWLTQTNVNRWKALPIMSNEEIDGTLVYQGRAIYNMSARYSGSPYHETVDGPAGTRACHYIWSMPADDQLLGTTAFNKIHWPGNDIQDDTIYSNSNDSTLQREQAANTLLRGLGVPWISRRYVIVYVNGTRRGQVMEDSLRPSGSVPDAYFPDDEGGSLYKIQPWFEGTAFPDSTGYIAWANKSWAIVAPYRTTGGAYKTARYRWHYEPRDVPVSANDYTNVFTLLDAMNSYNDPHYPEILSGEVDVDQWLRVVAANHAAGNWDCYGIQNGQNVYGYVSPQRRWQLFMFDFNIVLGNRISWGPGASLDVTQETAWEKMYGVTGTPVFRRLYWRALKELANGALLAAVANPLLDAKYAALRASGVAAASPQPIKDWIASARASIATQVTMRDSTSFTMTSGPVFTSSNTVALSGTAPLEVESFTVNGQSAVVRWTSTVAWTLIAAVPTGTNQLQLEAFDRYGRRVPGASGVVTVVSTAIPDSPEGSVVFSEIMHQPAGTDAHFVEIFNRSATTAFDLGGWQVNGLSYFFPVGRMIFPQERLVLARSYTAFANTYGVSNVVAGVFDGSLQPDGETLSLVTPTGLVVDRVRYETNAPWPVGALQPGCSLQLRDAGDDNSRAGNWAVGTTNASGTSPQWTYFTTNLVVASSSRFYLYLQTAGELYLDDLTLVAGTVPEVGTNLFANPGIESTISGSWTGVGNHITSTRSTTVKRTGSASLRVLATGAGTGSGNSVYQDVSPALTAGATYTLSLWFLPSTNASVALTRFSGGTALPWNIAFVPVVPNAACTPGRANSVAMDLPPFPTLWLNEVQPRNLTGPLDNYGERDPWVEIYNSGNTTQSLAGLYLGTNYGNPMLWSFPTNATVPPRQFRVVWLDGQPQQSAGDILHAGFRLGGDTGSLALSRYVSNAVQNVDYLNFTALPGSHSYGSYPDGQPFYRQSLARVTPGATNDASLPAITVFINEWMAENTGFILDPATARYDDWFEIYNPTAVPAELGGYYLTDTFANLTKFRIPTGYRVPARGYLLVWADDATSANTTNSPDLHVNFKLSKDGEAIGLFAPGGDPVDAVLFNAQIPNQSEGSIPDGGNLRLFLTTPTPGGPNIPPPADTPPSISGLTWVPGDSVSLNFSTAPGHYYRVEFKPDLRAVSWTPLGDELFATGTSLTATDAAAAEPHRFYRVVMVR